jgi:iron(III) transport system permease protein
VEALYLYPIAFLNAQAALANLDPSMVEAARNLGAGRFRTFFSIRLPLIRSGVFAGASIVFIWSFTELGTPLMVGFNRLTAVQVFDELQTTAPQGDAYALVVVLLAISVLVYGLSKLVFGRPIKTITPKAGIAKSARRIGGIKTAVVVTPFVVVLIAATIPHVGVILTSVSSTGSVSLQPQDWTLEHHQDLVGGPEGGSEIRGLAVTSVANSAKYALAATALDLVLGFGIAWLVVRRRGRLTFLLDSMAMLPLAVPGLVLAFGYFALTQTDTILARLDPMQHDPTPLLVLAYAVRRLPFMVRSCAAGLEQLPETMEEAAVDVGASWSRTLSRITLPLLAPSFLAGGILVFSRSMLEVSDSLILAFDRQTYPMTKAIWSLASIPASGMESASVLGCWGMLLLLVTFAIASKVLGKRLGGLFRL